MSCASILYTYTDGEAACSGVDCQLTEGAIAAIICAGVVALLILALLLLGGYWIKRRLGNKSAKVPAVITL